MISGYLLIDKEKGVTSFDVIRELKKKFRGVKFGHTGTLDPNTTGLMVIGCNRATKTFQFLGNKKKEYIATVKLGFATDTLDIDGEVLETKEIKEVTKEELEKVCNEFIGSYMQLPPKFSAKKIAGKKAYDLAREGIEFDIKPCLVDIFEIEVLDYKSDEFIFRCVVGKGTYVRSLMCDILEKVDNIGTLIELRRTMTDGFLINDSSLIEDITKDSVISLKDFLLNDYRTKTIYGSILNVVKNGGKLNVLEEINYPILYVDQENNPIAIYDIVGDVTKPIFMVGEL